MRHEIKRAPKAVILADGAGSGLLSQTGDCPTCLLSVGRSAILERMIRNCLSYGISQYVVVLGHKTDQIKDFVDAAFRGVRVTYIINDQYQKTNTSHSLMLASPAIGASGFIKLDARVVFDGQILRRLLDTDLSDVLCIDRGALIEGAVKVVANDEMRVQDIGRHINPKTALGTCIGIEKISATIAPTLFSELSGMVKSAAHGQDTHEVAYASLIAQGTNFHALDVTGMDWTAINTDEDLATANAMFVSPITTVSREHQRLLDSAAGKKTMTL